MSKTVGWIVAAVIVGGGAGAFYYYWTHPDAPPAVAEQATEPEAVPPESPDGVIRHPIPPQETDTSGHPQPLPQLNLSDQPVARALGEMFGESSVARYLIPDRVVRRIVITVDNLPREKLAVQMRPVKSLEGGVTVTGDPDAGGPVTLNAENYARYKPMIDLVEAANVEQLSSLYFRLYPLFQQAYEELGYPGKYFNDRLVEAIDHLLETPEIAGDIQLVRPKVFYEYADPELERRSAGQKLLIRMGPENAGVVKEKLKALRAAVTQSPPAQ
jgi:hypothetical protein